MIQRFNYVVAWITGEICSQILLKQRILTIEKFVALGKQLLDLGNFNGVMEIVAGLHRCADDRRLISIIIHPSPFFFFYFFIVLLCNG